MDTSAPSAAGAIGGDTGATAADLGGGGNASAALGQGAPNYGDTKKLLDLFRDAKKQCLDARWMFERLWWRNLLYVLGRQWIYYDRRRGQWLDKRLAKWMPRPVTNKCSEAVEALVATFGGIKLATLARPIGHGAANIAAAEVADDLQPFIHGDHLMDQVLRDMDFWLVVTGNAFLHPYWDKSASLGAITLPYETCLACGQVSSPADLQGPQPTCPQCGAVNQFGKGPEEQMPVGKGRTDVLSPFELAVPPIYREFEMSPMCLQMAWRPKTYFEEKYPDLAKKLVWQKTPSERSMQLLRMMATQNDMSALPLSFAWGAGQEIEQEGQTEFALWIKPTKDYPEGLYFRVVGEGEDVQILPGTDGEESPGPLPYHTKEGHPIFPFIHVSYAPVGGRLWARSPLDLVIQKQDQINQLDSMIQLIVQRMANPIWLEPKGSEVKHFTGEPGLVLRYNALAASGAKPERIEGSNIPASLFELRQQYLTDFEMLSGTYDVLKGAKPPGVEAFSAMQLLVERSQSRLTTVFAERGEAYRKWYEVALELERQFGPTERTYSVLSPNRGWTYYHFQAAKLDGSVEIVVEDGSQAPKTNLGRRAAIEQASQLQMIDPADPEQRYNILTGLGLNDLVSSLDYDVKAALREQDAFEQWVSSGEAMAQLPQIQFAQQQYAMQVQQAQQLQMQAQQVQALTGVPANTPPPPQMPELSPYQLKEYDNDAVHTAEHRKWANSDTARQIFQQAPPLEQVFVMHLQAHQQRIQQAQMQQAMMQAGPQKPQQGGAMERSQHESGNPDDVPKGNSEKTQGRGPE